MEVPNLDAVDLLYNQEASLYSVSFNNSQLAALSRGITRLLNSLGDQKELSAWPDIIMTLKKVRFELATLPIPHEQVITNHLMSQLESVLKTCRSSFPENVEQLLYIIRMLELLQSSENQFICWIQSECVKNTYQNICLCPPNAKYVKLIEDFLARDEILSGMHLKVLSPQCLKQFIFYDRILFCGSIDLFAENQFRNFEYVWRSPRTANLYFLSYDWIKSHFKPEPSFNVGSDKSFISIKNLSVKGEESEIENDIPQNEKRKIDISEIDFTFNDMLPSSFSTIKPHTNHYDAICECRLVVLEDESFIYLEIEGSSRIVTFTHEVEIQKILNSELEAGMSLVVRTEGSGDSIAAVADILLGKEAEKIRNKQEEWKIAFRKKLFTYSSVDEVADVLTSLGAPTASDTNVRNWQRNETIKPHNLDDFKAIMNFSGHLGKTQGYWKNAKRIDLAHKKAGKVIKKLLLSKITKSTLVDLEKYGRIDIEISGLAGKVSVIRIESILPENYELLSGKSNIIMNVEGGLKWQE